jgi:hypothetical protein
MRTIIVVQGRSEIGKTPAILEVYEKLSGKGWTPAEEPLRHGKNNEDIEVRLKCEENEKFIGISSMGDPESDLKGRLKLHADNNCEVILTSSRTSRSTVKDIMEIARPENEEKKYDIIWTKHFYHEGGTEKMPNGVDLNEYLNEQFAKGMADLILSLL